MELDVGPHPPPRKLGRTHARLRAAWVPTVPCLLQGNGDTPLRIAAYLGHSEAVRLLLEHAGPQAEKYRERQKGMPLVDSSRTVAGRTACEWAREQGHTEVADLL